MAPAGTVYRPPNGIVTAKPAITKTPIIINDDDKVPNSLGESSDEEEDDTADIKPSVFAAGSGESSFGASPASVNGHARFQSIVANAAYNGPQSGRLYNSVAGNNAREIDAAMAKLHAAKSKPSADSMASGYGSSKRPQIQTRPDRARPIEDIKIEDLDQQLRGKVTRLIQIYPSVSVLTAKSALLLCKGNLDDAAERLGSGAIVISDDEIESPQPAKKMEPQMKRGLNAPMTSIKDRYSSTQAPAPKQAATPPPKPKRKLMQGRRNPSSPAAPAASSPFKPQSPVISIHDYDDSDSGVASASDEDPELGGRVLKYLNSCSAEDLVELTNITLANAELMVAARPFRNLDIARTVAAAALKGGKKSTRAPIGDKIVDIAFEMFSGYEAIDALCEKCEELGKPLAAEMSKWGFDVFGAAKEGELEMTSFEDDAESQRDSGIGSPSSGAASLNGDNDDDLKIMTSTRKRVNYLKKPELMGEDCVLKDYQVVGLNWLALMYRHKLSGILADEMGLGKTCQVIALLSHLVETGVNGPHLVVCPGSTLENWLREFPKFAPKLVVEPYYGMSTMSQIPDIR
jgi:SWI/SNF-related matrix-associated actin-dependent regulator 1 of chromatin subfamily A